MDAIYKYLAIRSEDEGFSLTRAVGDLKALFTESKRGMESMVYYLNERGVEISESDFIDTQQLSDKFDPSPTQEFSWTKIRRQVANYLTQLTLIDTWTTQVELELEAIL